MNEYKEKKFLVKTMPYDLINNASFKEYIQMYVFSEKEKEMIIEYWPKYKLMDKHGFATITYLQHSNNNNDHTEWRYRLDPTEASSMYENKTYSFIVKQKTCEYKNWSIRLYDNNMIVGTYIYDDKSPFPNEIPNWIGEEITGNEKYTDKYIAKNGYPE